MAVWPFGRNSGRKRPRSGATLSDHEAPGVVVETGHSSDSALGRAQTSLSPSDELSRPSQKKRRTMTTSHPQNSKLRRRAHTKSTPHPHPPPPPPPPPHHHHHHHYPPPDHYPSPAHHPPLPSPPPSGRYSSPRMAPDPPEGRGSRGVGTGTPQIGDDAMAMDDDELQRVPTLYGGRRNIITQRRKSNRQARRLDDDAKAHAKAMANPALHRPTSDSQQSGRSTKKGSKRGRSGFGFGKSGDRSDISLPTPDSIHSSLSSESEAGFKLSALDSLAPRPTLQYAYPVHYCAPSRRPSQQKHFGVTDEILRAHKRIDSLVDDFDASDLRELMDRDKRRRERKLQRDRDKTEARLARRGAVQKKEEIQAQQTGAPPPINLNRGVMGRELGGRDSCSVIWVIQRRDSDVSIDSTSQPPPPLVSEKEEMRRSIEEQLSQHPAEHPPPLYATESAEHIEPEHVERVQEPDMEISLSAPTPDIILQEPPADQASPVDQQQQLDLQQQQQQMPTPPHSPNAHDALQRKKSTSRSSLVSETGKFTVVKLPRSQEQNAPVTPEEPRRRKSRRLSLSTFFKWPGRSKATTPASSFSNTSREEMLAAAAQSQAPPGHRPPSQKTIVPVRRVASNAPKRTRSRFREDLPELPVPPPSSQLPSGEANAGIHHADGTRPMTEHLSHNFLSVQPTPRSGTPSSEHHTLETMHNTPTSWRPHTRSPVPISLGSVDSEGSWLAGRRIVADRKSPVSRTVPRTTHHQSADHSHASLSNSFDDPIPDDEYMAQLSPVPNHTIVAGGSVGEARPSSDEDEDGDGDEDARTELGDAKWGSVDARQARVVSAHELKSIRSREGLLNSLTEPEQQAELADTDGENDAHTSIVSSDSNGLQRARSIQFGKGHLKHISIGSSRSVVLSSQKPAENQ